MFDNEDHKAGYVFGIMECSNEVYEVLLKKTEELGCIRKFKYDDKKYAVYGLKGIIDELCKECIAIGHENGFNKGFDMDVHKQGYDEGYKEGYADLVKNS